MALFVSAQQAAANALTRWLTSDIAGVPEAQRWPEPDVPLPATAITCLLAGPRQDTVYDKVQVGMAIVDVDTALYTYAIASCRQNIQLDVWATSDLARDDILARMDIAMHAGPGLTIPGSGGDTVALGLLLPLSPTLDGGWSGYVDYWLDAFQTSETSAENVRDVQYRAMSRGWAEFTLTVSDQPGQAVARMSAIELRQRITTGDLTSYIGADATQVNRYGVTRYAIP